MIDPDDRAERAASGPRAAERAASTPGAPPSAPADGAEGTVGAPTDALAARATALGPGQPSDHELIRRAQRGEEEAFRLLVERHQQRAYRVARTLVPNAEDAADLAQEAFLRVFRSLDRFDFDHEFTTWLYRIVTNLGIDHLRKRRQALSTAGTGPDDEGEFDLVDEDAPRPSDRIERNETAALVRAIIDRMPAHFRSVLALRELEGLPCTEIARIVGATHVTVRWRLHRGRKLFQDEWERLERLREARGGRLLPSDFEGAAPEALDAP